MTGRIFSFELHNKRVLGFDTGLDSRTFAQAKFAQCITEPGLIIFPNSSCGGAEAADNSIGLWKASGVIEYTHNGGKTTMVVWGPDFEGERLDLLFNEFSNTALPQDPVLQDKTLAAICVWIQALLVLEKNPPPLLSVDSALLFSPSAAIIPRQNQHGEAIFFAPPCLVRRCILTGEDSARFTNRYVRADLGGADSAAFSAAAMLYRIFAGTSPFSATDDSILQQDMRDGNVLPVHLAAPGLDQRLAALIQKTLYPLYSCGNAETQKRNVKDNKKANVINQYADPSSSSLPFGAATPLREKNQKKTLLLEQFIEILRVNGETVSAASLVQPVSGVDRILLEKEKKHFLRVTAASVKTKRFVARNAALLTGCLAALVAVIFVVYTISQSRVSLPTTAGMEPVQVIESYYHAFGSLNYQMMEACAVRGAGRNDIVTVINLLVIHRVRGTYERHTSPSVISAREWQESGKIVPAHSRVFGVTDLRVMEIGKQGTGKKDIRELYYQVDYILWVPYQAGDDAETEAGVVNGHPLPSYRSDLVTLVLKKGNWRIAGIQRTERNGE